jgi:hypothetical protein
VRVFVCPSCSADVEKKRSRAEAVCGSCGTRFRPPTPFWERSIFGFVFLMLGAFFGSIAVIIVLMGASGPADPSVSRGVFGCSSLMGILALVCLIQSIRELIGHGKNTVRVDEDDSSDSPPRSESRRRIRRIPPPIPREKAEALVRKVAEKHGAKGILRTLGQLPSKHLAHAAARFAQAMRDDETPLALLDASFLKNGKAGLLLTNRSLYSSFYARPIWLADIEDVTFARPGVNAFLGWYFLGPLYLLINGIRPYQNRLCVNDKVIYATGNRLRFDFWIELLSALADEARHIEDASGEGKTEPKTVVLEITRHRADRHANEMRQIRDPSWGQIEQSIRDLDRDALPSLRLWAGEVEQAPALDVIGGNGHYILRELGADGWVYYDPSQGEEEIEVSQSIPGHRYPAYYVCGNLQRVLQIVRHYYDTGAPE